MKYTYCVSFDGRTPVTIYSNFDAMMASNRCRKVVDMEDDTANFFLETKEVLEREDNMYRSECE